MEGNTRIVIDKDAVTGKVSDTLFGIFLEDINYTCDGGLNANMVRNFSFDDVYMNGKHLNMLRFITKTAGRVKTIPDRLRYWSCIDGSLTSSSQHGVCSGSWYAIIHSDGKCQVTNKGYNGRNHDLPAMAIVKDAQYEFTCYIRNEDFTGNIDISLRDAQGDYITDTRPLEMTGEWTFIRVVLQGRKTALGELVITLTGKGDVDIDCITLQNTDTWGKDQPKWSQGKLRKDLVLALKDLKPTFMRFPGGCIVEGVEDGNEYQWKNSIGPVIERHQDYNLWATEDDDSGYIQSRQLGFYEFFLLCEDLHMEPLPVVWAGINCQMRKRGKVDCDAPDFYERVIQNALDLIEYANGDPAKNEWAKKRADAGHPEPFHLKFIGIGNENIGEDYFKRFDMIKSAIDEKYEGITCILSAGGMAQGADFEAAWDFARNKHPDVYVDEHCYKKPATYMESDTRYDHYDRSTAKVFLGEYAAFDILNRKLVPNQYETALAEAAFLTGIERNSDVVKMTCYAPLFALIDGQHWKHNMIYFNPTDYVKSVNYYVQQMYGTTVGEQILDIDGQIPGALRVSATATRDRIVLKLVNISAQEQHISLNIKHFMCSKKRITWLRADALTDRNTLTFEGTPVYKVKPGGQESTFCGEEVITLPSYSFYVVEIF